MASGWFQFGLSIRNKAGLASSADRALPIVGNLFKGSPRGDAGVRIASHRVIDHRADLANPFARDRFVGLARDSFALQSLQGDAIGFSVMLFDRGEQAEVFGCCSEEAGVLL